MKVTSCSDCVYFRYYVGKSSTNVGTCVRNSPAVVPVKDAGSPGAYGYRAVWPTVRTSDVCGDGDDRDR